MDFFDYALNILITFCVAAVPFVELRGSIPLGAGMGLGFFECVLVSIIGNMLPVIFIILFIRKIFDFCRKRNWFVKQIKWLENRVMKKSAVVKKYEAIGLSIFVGIPLPGTGAWTGALIAALLDIRLKDALPAIFLGVVIAGLLLGGVSYGFLGFLKAIFIL